jgi:hypothetical protein
LKPCFDFHLGANAHQTFEGKLSKWFDNFIAPPKPTSNQCWRTSDVVGCLCPGTRIDHNYYIVSLPVILIIEFKQEDLDHPLQWNIPPKLTPGHPSMVKAHGLIYEIIGISEVSGPQNASHFTAWFVHENVVYGYDDMTHDGRALALSQMEVKTHLAGFPPRLHPVGESENVIPRGSQTSRSLHRLPNTFKMLLCGSPLRPLRTRHIKYLLLLLTHTLMMDQEKKPLSPSLSRLRNCRL